MESLASHPNRAVPTRSELLGHVYKINKRVSFFCHEFLFMLLSCHFTEILMVKNKLFLVYCLGLEICRSSVSSLASCCSYIVVKEKKYTNSSLNSIYSLPIDFPRFNYHSTPKKKSSNPFFSSQLCSLY